MSWKYLIMVLRTTFSRLKPGMCGRFCPVKKMNC